MEPQQDPHQQPLEQQQQQQPPPPTATAVHDQQENSSSGSSSKSSFLCRQTSTRWTPTSDQIRILKDLYYNNGVRSPSAEQIQRISARLRQYGKIEGKNVFYWFQNHKARERQKKRFTVDTIAMQRASVAAANTPHPYANHHHPHHHLHHAHASVPPNWKLSQDHTKYTILSPVVSAGGGEQMMGNLGYGSLLTAEKSFRECSISPGGGGGSSNVVGGYMNHNNMGWASGGGGGVGEFRSSVYLNGKKPIQFFKEEYSPTVMETLPLFPMHSDDDGEGEGEEDNTNGGGFCSGDTNTENGYYDNWFGESREDEQEGSLELSLSSSFATGVRRRHTE